MFSKTRILILTAALLVICTGCGQLLTGTFRVSEGIGKVHEEGTLILAEVVVELTREQTLTRFSSSDLQAVRLAEPEIKNGSGVFVSPFKQRQTALSPADGIFALVAPSTSLDPRQRCGPQGCSYGGDAVAIRVVKKVLEGRGSSGLHVIEAVVEPASVQGDCSYVPRGRRLALHCKSLDHQGWEWDDDVFVKRPTATFRK